MDCIDAFKRAAMALQTDVTWLTMVGARKSQTIRMKSCRISSGSSIWPAWIRQRDATERHAVMEKSASPS